MGANFFFLPQAAALFCCLQSFSKLHPDFDSVLEQIAKRAPEAWFVFIEAEITSYPKIFLSRIAISAPTLAKRLILLSRMGRQQFISLAGCLDVLLDPPYFGSGITLYEAIHTGTPIVSLEGDFLRSRFVAGAYRLMGLKRPPIAHSVAAHWRNIGAPSLNEPMNACMTVRMWWRPAPTSRSRPSPKPEGNQPRPNAHATQPPDGWVSPGSDLYGFPWD